MSYVCSSCGREFTVRQEVLDRYPGWTPRKCLDCLNETTVSGGGGVRRPSATRGRDLTLGEVLASYTEGPETGVFTDGASEGNPGPGGWGAVRVAEGRVVAEERGAEPHTTNNRMELTALISGLRMVAPDESIDVYTDSQLVVNTINVWAAGWETRGWTKKSSGPIANLELVKEAYYLARQRPDVRIRWIPAHSGYRWNEYADALATAYRRETI
ncbi:MAG: ribonuclease HI [Actinobacteria bacterium]|nr:ribonuclease HI [Actinomycetota bacterium]MCI0679482.1 ribonuclease HI [Actinomycetota bacterium]